MAGSASSLNNLAVNLKKSVPGWSREFDALIRAIGECKSKSEEDAIIAREVETLKPRLKDAKLDKRQLKEVLVRLVYVEMLGHDASWGHVRALQACSDTSLVTKKVAYLASGLFLNYKSDLLILVVNTITQDLKSDNFLVVCTALTACCKLIGPDLINAVLPGVVALLTHGRELVRKKAILALHRFHQLDPAGEGPLQGVELHRHFRQALCDKDPAVMSAALCALHDVIRADPAPHRNLVASFVSILKQIIEHRLPKAYDYHRTPAPFAQVRLLKVLALLGAGDRAASENMGAVVADALRRAATGHTIGHAVAFEAVQTITAIYPNPALLQAAAEVVAGFLRAGSPNLRCAGVDALAAVVRCNARYAAEHQLAVIDCLEDPDPTLKHKTLDLLCKMTQPSNCEVIVEKLLAYLRVAGEDAVRAQVAARIGDLAERYAPSPRWFTHTMNQVFELGGDAVAPELAQGLVRLVAEGAGEDDAAADAALRREAVTSYLALLRKPKLPDILLKVILWVLGEYGDLAPEGVPAVLDRLCALAEAATLSVPVRGHLITALAKLCSQHRLGAPEAVQGVLQTAAASHSTELQQRAQEAALLLASDATLQAAALPHDAASEDVQVDPALPFLDAYVAAAVAAGAAPYLPPEQRAALGFVRPTHHEEVAQQTHALRFAAYEKAAAPAPAQAALAPAASPPSTQATSQPSPTGMLDGFGAAAASTAPPATAADPVLTLKGAGARRWGPAQAAPAPSPSRPAAAAASSALGAGGGAPAAAASHPSASAAARGAPAAPVVSEAKARLMSSLFGDGGEDAAAAPPSRPRSARSTPQKAAQAAPAPRAPQPADLLLGLDDAPAPHSSTAEAPQPRPPDHDPFAMMEGLSLAAPAPAQPQPAALTPMLDFDSPPAASSGLSQPFGSAPGALQQPGPAAHLGHQGQPHQGTPGFPSPAGLGSSQHMGLAASGGLGGRGMAAASGRALGPGAQRAPAQPGPAKGSQQRDPFADLLG